MPQFVRRVHPPLRFIPTAYNPWIMRAVLWALPFLLRVRIRPWLPAGIRRIEVENVDRLVDLYAELEAGKSRFLMAVRHVEVDDPLSGLYLCSRAVQRAAKARGIQLRQPVHTHFIYERGMTIWAGRGLGWLLSRMGGTPIRRGRRPDWVGLKAARKLMVEGEMPLVVAPEGATNGHSERLGPLEPGVAQMGFWCAEDLQRAGRAEQVHILPIGLQYRYVTPHWTKLETLLSQLEKQSGLDVSKWATGERSAEFARASEEANKRARGQICHQRILRLGVHLMEKMEAFYTRYYHQSFPAKKKEEDKPAIAPLPPQEKTAVEASTPIGTQDASERLKTLLNRALQVSEQFFNLPEKGTLAGRCRRIEEASWNYIYREDLPEISTLSPLDRGLADWAAQAASMRELHMRMVESFVAVNGDYLNEKPSFERCAETTLLISDMLARLSGDKLPGRPRLGDRWVKMTVQPPISISPRLADYQQSRRAGRAAVAAVTEEIRQALESSIER
ncbi:MAG: 1-acyl-sn-glycerol-3-phosphate acyltransferase [Cyanobacteria bacterium J06597_16]